MSGFPFLFRELLGSIRARSALLLSASSLFVFVSIASFATLLLLGGTTPSVESSGIGPDEVVASLSPRLSAEAVDGLYFEIQARSDVSSISFRFAEEVSPGSTGGRFFIRATSAEEAPAVARAVEALDGIMAVTRGEPAPPPAKVGLSPALRIGLLVALVTSIVLSLVLARGGYRALLRAFRGEIRIIRLSGTPERTIAAPVAALGLLLGLLTGLLLVVGVYLGLYAAGDSAATISGVENGGRVLGVTAAGFVLSLLLGGLSGLLGASLLSAREFTSPSRR
jgi:hypothetical protein